jgi:ABC-type lipoprotein release transport system permease subunit
MAVMLVVGIVSLMNSIPFSIRATYSYSRFFLAMTPRGDMTLTPRVMSEVRAQTPVPIEKVIVCRFTPANVKSIVGKWPFGILGMEREDIQYYMKKLGVKKLDGRLPESGMPEAVVSEPVARNLHLKIGSVLIGPDGQENYSPKHVKIVGIADTPEWFMVNDIEYQRRYHFPPLDNLMFFTKDIATQQKLDHWATDHFKGQRAQVFAFHMLEKQTEDMFNILYKILNVVILTLVVVITFMMGMLINIYQSQRIQEFGLLQAIGYTKRQLLSRCLKESILVVLLGWALGVVAAYGLLNAVKVSLMDPQAFSLNITDPVAFSYSIPIPVAILVTAALTIYFRFRKFDPVTIVERRLV